MTITEGTNLLVGTDPPDILAGWQRVGRAATPARARVPPLWDGHAAERIVGVLPIVCGTGRPPAATSDGVATGT